MPPARAVFNKLFWRTLRPPLVFSIEGQGGDKPRPTLLRLWRRYPYRVGAGTSPALTNILFLLYHL